MKMNLPNKITMLRIFLAIGILLLLVIPWYSLGVNLPAYHFLGKELVELKYLIAGVMFVIAAVTDFLDGHIARKRKIVTDFGKVMDAIADKVLVNGLLVILAYTGFISVIVPVVIITRDIFVDSIKMASGNKGKVIGASWSGKLKTVLMMVGITLTLFYNIPFVFFNFRFDQILVLTATVLSVVSGCQYYLNTKDYIFTEK
ncbi:MAG TPA: CDP-diacylglycerol--glycerol-3-phosphate 3-phosphatidyltransferase [Bacilli bacterium]|nr:CDP-diacylglycerol--glycerol-3-phosphate 3-phosphatidyltransferase [Bacilli bacterium]